MDFITLNAYQASDWSGIEINTINDAKQAVEIIAGNEKKKVIIYIDELGVVYFDGRNTFHIPPLPSLRVDTMAATDAFNGAFASKIAAGGTMPESVLFASAFLSAFIEQKGVTSMPSLSQVQARLKLRIEDIRPQVICNEKRCI